MMLFVAMTGPPFTGVAGVGVEMAELFIDDSDVVDDDEKTAVEPDSWDERD